MRFIKNTTCDIHYSSGWVDTMKVSKGSFFEYTTKNYFHLNVDGPARVYFKKDDVEEVTLRNRGGEEVLVANNGYTQTVFWENHLR